MLDVRDDSPTLRASQLGSSLASRLGEINASLRTAEIDPVIIDRSGRIKYPPAFTSNPAVSHNLTQLAVLWRAIEAQLADYPASKEFRAALQEPLLPFFKLSPFTELCCDPATPRGHPALVRMLVSNCLTFFRDKKYDGLSSGKGLFEQLDPMGALLQHFHTYSTPAAIAHRNRLATVTKMLPDIIESFPEARLRSILIYGLGATCEIANLDLRNVWKTVLCSPDNNVLNAAHAFLNQKRGLSSTPTFNPGKKQFFLKKPQDFRQAVGISLCLGMIDYTPYAQNIIEGLLDNTAESGHVIVSFITDKNPHKHFLNQVLNWDLIHRSENDIRSICAELNLQEDNNCLTAQQERGSFRIISNAPDGVNAILILRK